MSAATINRTLAAMLILAGLALWAGAAFVVHRDWPTLTALATQPSPRVLMRESCAAAAGALGFTTSKRDYSLRVSLPAGDAGGLKRAFARASVVAAMCDGYELESFCAGSGCTGGMLFMSLRQVGNQ